MFKRSVGGDVVALVLPSVFRVHCCFPAKCAWARSAYSISFSRFSWTLRGYLSSLKCWSSVSTTCKRRALNWLGSLRCTALSFVIQWWSSQVGIRMPRAQLSMMMVMRTTSRSAPSPYSFLGYSGLLLLSQMKATNNPTSLLDLILGWHFTITCLHPSQGCPENSHQVIIK